MAQLLLGIAPGEEKSRLFLHHVTSVPIWKLLELAAAHPAGGAGNV